MGCFFCKENLISTEVFFYTYSFNSQKHKPNIQVSEEIDYFVYLKGGQMILPLPEDKPFDRKDDPFGLVTHTRFRWDAGGYGKGYCRIFEHGDTIFFKKEGMWLGSAPGLADTYVKADRS